MKKENSFNKFKYLIIFLLISGGFFIFSQSAKALPLAPDDLTAVGNYLAGRYQVNLEWQYNQPAEIDGFYIYRNLVNIAVVDNNTTTFIDTTVEYELGITYNYYVTGYNNEGESEPSNTATIITANSPNIPDDLKVDGWGNLLEATSTEDFTPEFSWLHSDTENTPMGAYQIQVCEGIITGNLCPDNQMIWDSGKISLETPVPSGNTATVSYNDADGVDDNLDSHGHPLDWSTPTSQHQYHWRVRVWNTSEEASLWSEEGPVFSYSDSVTANLIFSDDLTTLTYKNLAILFGYSVAEWYTNAKGEIRIPYQWTLNNYYTEVYDSPYAQGVSFNAPAIAVDKQNRVHLAFMEDTDGNSGTTLDGQLKYAILKNGVLESLENVNNVGECGYNVSLALDDYDLPHLSYYSCYNTAVSDYAELMYAYNDGSQWTKTPLVNNINSQAIFSKTSIAIDNNNLPHISYHRWTTANINDGLYYIYKISSEAWSTPQQMDTNKQRGSSNAIAIDSNNNYHIAYNQTGSVAGTNRGIYYISNAQGSIPITIDNSSCTTDGCIGQVSIDLDAYNNPHFSYRVKENDNTYLLKYAKYIAGIITIETAKEIPGTTGIWSSSIKIYGNNTSTIAYILDNNTLRYVNNSAGSWFDQELINGGGIQARYGLQALDNSDLPYVSFSDNAQQRIFYQKHTFSTSSTYAVASLNVDPTTDTIYGVRFHASFSKPGGVGSIITFKVSANGGENWVDAEYKVPGCLLLSEGCEINFASQGAGENEDWTGNVLWWQVIISTTDANFSPRIGSVTFEEFNIPPRITYCSYFPPAIDPGQSVQITASYINEPDDTLTYRWCYDESGALGACGGDPIEDPQWTPWGQSNPINHQYNNANIYNPAVQMAEVTNPPVPPNNPTNLSNVYTCPNLFVGNVTIAWLETKFGNVYSQGNIFGYEVPCEICGQSNATYKLQAGGQIIGFVSQCRKICMGTPPFQPPGWGLTQGQCESQCIQQYSAVYNFPKTPYFRNALVDLKSDPMIKQLLESPSQAPYGFPEDNFIDVNDNYYFKDIADISDFWSDYYGAFSPLQYANVYYFKDSSNMNIVNLNGPNQANPPDWCADLKGFNNGYDLNGVIASIGDGLFIIDGDLHIYSGFYSGYTEYGGNCTNQGPTPTSTPKITYSNSPAISKISHLASVAFIIKGDLIIEPDVEELAGTFIVLGKDGVECTQNDKDYANNCGTVYTAGREPFDKFGDAWIPVANRKPLKINGLVIAKNFQLGRNYFDWETNQAGEVFINDGRAILNPPPGLEDIISSLPNWRTKLAP